MSEVRGTRWFVILLLAAVTFVINGLASEAITFLMPSTKDTFALSAAAAARLAPAYLMGLLLTALPAGWLVDRCSARFTITLGSVVFILAYLAFSFARTPLHLLVAAAMVGVGAALAQGIPATIVTFRCTDRPGLISGVLGVVAGAGSALLPWVLSPWLRSGSWREGTSLIAALALLVCVPAALLLPPVRGSTQQPSTRQTIRSQLQPAALLLAGSQLTVAFVVTAISFCSLLALDAQGVPKERSTTMMVAMNFIMVPASILTGWLIDRVGVWTVFIAWVIGVAVAVLALAGANASSSGLALGWVFVVAWGVLGSAALQVLPVLALRQFGAEGLGTRLGLIQLVLAVPVSYAPVAFGHAADSTGTYTAGLYAAAVLAVLAPLPAAASLFPQWLRRQQQRRAPMHQA